MSNLMIEKYKISKLINDIPCCAYKCKISYLGAKAAVNSFLKPEISIVSQIHSK